MQTKKLSLSISDDLEEGEVTEEDSADELEDCFKFKENEVRTRFIVNIIASR